MSSANLSKAASSLQFSIFLLSGHSFVSTITIFSSFTYDSQVSGFINRAHGQSSLEASRIISTPLL
jgi:hypothetical protein